MLEPALRDDEWRNGRVSWLKETGIALSLAGELGLLIEGSQHITIGKNGHRLTALIAMANAALKDDDPRKLTRAHLDALRAAMEEKNGDSSENTGRLKDLANALEAYLPR